MQSRGSCASKAYNFSSKVFIWGFPKIRDTILGAPIIRTIVYWGLYSGSLFWETTI